MRTVGQGPFLAYGSIGKRFLALLLDSAIIYFVQMLVFIPLLSVFGISLWSFEMNPNAITAGAVVMAILSILSTNLIFLVLGWFYFAGMESSLAGGTIGKRLLGLKVTDSEGRRIDFWRASARYFCKIFLSSMFFFLGYVIAAFTSKKQALHDILSGCIVLRK